MTSDVLFFYTKYTIASRTIVFLRVDLLFTDPWQVKKPYQTQVHEGFSGLNDADSFC